MSKIEINGSELTSAIETATSMQKAIKDSLSKADKLQAKLKDCKWRGEAKQSFVAYFDLIYQYHQDFEKALNKQKKALKFLDEAIPDFDSLPAPTKVRNL